MTTFVKKSKIMEISWNWTHIRLFGLRIKHFESPRCYKSNGTSPEPQNCHMKFKIDKKSQDPTDPTVHSIWPSTVSPDPGQFLFKTSWIRIEFVRSDAGHGFFSRISKIPVSRSFRISVIPNFWEYGSPDFLEFRTSRILEFRDSPNPDFVFQPLVLEPSEENMTATSPRA